jgi:putative transposase
MIDGLISVGRGRIGGRHCAVVQGFRYPVEIISHCVWLNYRFPLRGRAPRGDALGGAPILGSIATTGRKTPPTHQTAERAMKRFTSSDRAQRFLSAFSGISPHFRPTDTSSAPMSIAEA